MSEEAVIGAAEAEPFFSLQLGSNGGVLAPSSFEELDRWIGVEEKYFDWLYARIAQEHPLRSHLTQVRTSRAKATRAQNLLESAPEESRRDLATCAERLKAVFITGGFPHSSTPTARRIESFREESGDVAAIHFATVLLMSPEGGVRIQPASLNEWRAVFEGLIERFHLVTSIPAASDKAALSSFDALRGRAEHLLAEKSQTYEALHRSFEDLSGAIRSERERQGSDFAVAQIERSAEFLKQSSAYKDSMSAIEKTYNEALALRAPAEYWRMKGDGHRLWGWVTGSLTFAGIAAAGLYLGVQIHDVLSGTPKGTAPESWRVATLALVGVFSVWGLRLLVRMFLSHLHLLTDARERVVMVKTYLSLLEGNQLSSKEDRQLVLQALFRPASDGIVKDEALPFSLAEALTRPGK